MGGMAVAAIHYHIHTLSGLVRPTFVRRAEYRDRENTAIFVVGPRCADRHTTHAATGVVRVLGRRDPLLALGMGVPAG
jgi:hypothetical protein